MWLLKMSKELGESRRSGKDAASCSKSRATPSENNVLCLPRAHCLPVARALIALLLHMDFTCNLDTFLLTCKVESTKCFCWQCSVVVDDFQTVQIVGRGFLVKGCRICPNNLGCGGVFNFKSASKYSKLLVSGGF